MLQTTPELSSLVVPDVCLADKSGVDFYGRFSPTARASMALVLHIMPELQVEKLFRLFLLSK
jgi:hypothetical protein